MGAPSTFVVLTSETGFLEETRFLHQPQTIIVVASTDIVFTSTVVVVASSVVVVA
jgi:hypothetical protein